MRSMKTATTTALLLLFASSTFAASSKATPCLNVPDAKGCLAGVAMTALASEKSAESRTDGYASLLSSLVKAGVRRDDVFAAAINSETAPLLSRWSLAVARKAYAQRFSVAEASEDDPGRIEAVADHLRNRPDGLERLFVAFTACEAKEDMSPAALAEWDGVLDRLCRIKAADSDALDKMIPGLSAMVAPVIDAYNRDEHALRQSLLQSLNTLSGYHALLAESASAKERENLRGILAFGHLLTATALATAGYREGAFKALETSLGHLRKAPSMATEFQMFFSQASWIYAKAGRRDEASRAIKESMAKVDRKRSGSGGDRATDIAIAIETLSLLETTH